MIKIPSFSSSRILPVAALLVVTNTFGQQTPPSAYSSSTGVNFVRTWDAKYPESSAGTLVTKSYRDITVATRYTDGLARPLQTVLKQGSVESGTNIVADIVSPVVYDDYGREQFKYTGFAANTTGGNSSIEDGAFKLNPFQQQAVFMAAQYYGQGESWFYSKTEFESSPLNRATKAMSPGNSWIGSNRGVEMKYWFNKVADDVKKWDVTEVSGNFGTYAINGVYTEGELQKSVTVDEHGKQVQEFKDKAGKVILKKVQLTATADNGSGVGYTGWLCTYYLYDDLGNLRCVIQPKGVELVIANSWSLTSNMLDEQCFRYEYDARNRMIMKKVPGAAAVQMVYDTRDRLVMTQDGNLYSAGKWLVTKYDALNRPIETGLWNDGNTGSYHRSAAYSSTSYPSTSGTYELLSVTHYDDYTSLPSGLSSTFASSWNSYFLSASNTVWPYPQTPDQSNAVLGLVTWTQVKVLGSSPAQYISTASIYDEKGRVIQVQSTNISGGTDIISTQYSWSGQPLITIQKQGASLQSGAQETVIVTKLNYDDLGRLASVEKKASHTLVNSGAMPSAYRTISKQEYDKLGQLKKKELGRNAANSAALENQAFEYNIRGWMLGMNRDFAKDVSSTANFFGFDLGYDKDYGYYYYNQQYNGNIEGMTWKNRGDGMVRKYDFAYDAANRLLRADYWYGTSPTQDFSVKMGDGYDVSSAYDANGNIKQMQQWGIQLWGSAQIDNLSYLYQSGSNKLARVTDANNDSGTKLGDFKDGTNTGTDDYSYDVNGNLNLDNNKAISGITYNHLNLPSVITVTNKGTITYVYDGAGSKLKKIVAETGQPGKTTLYMGGAVFENDVLQFLGHEEGRIRFKAAVGAIPASLEYDYMLKDHLGNVRSMLTEEQKTDAYPPASLETANLSTENALYGGLSNGRVNKNTVWNYPDDTYTNPNDFIQQLNGNGPKMGANMVLKVMAGDKFNLRVSSWYRSYGANPSTPNPITDLAGALATAVAGVNGGKATSSELNTYQLSTNAASSFLSSQTSSSGYKPKAYVNWIFLDEQFKYAGGGFEQVGEDEEFKVHVHNNVPVNKSGYLYIYVSNETPNIDVFFDNLQVTHIRGPLLEETHYYPFGLTMAGISSKALAFGEPGNKFKYNGIEQNSDFDLNMYDAFYRNLDPQIGRFWQIDPKMEDVEMVSPYSAMVNNPILYSDPLGDIVRNAHDEEVNLATGRRDATNAVLTATMETYGVTDRSIKKKAFLAAGHTKSEWKDFNAIRTTADRAESRLNTALSNQFEAQEDINQFQHDNPTLFNAVNSLPIDVHIGRTSDPAVTVDAGGGANAFNITTGGDIVGRMYNLDDFFGGAAVWRNGMAVWIQNGRGQYSTVLHETGHTVSMYGGVPAIGINGIPYGTHGNPTNVNDYVQNYARGWGGSCAECRTSPGKCNPTSAAAVAAEYQKRESPTRYVRRVNPHR